MTNPLPPGRYIQYKTELYSDVDGFDTPIFDNLALTYNVETQETPRIMVSGSSLSQLKYLLQSKQYHLAKQIILQYPHLFKREYLLKNYPNLYTQEELDFIANVLGEKIIKKEDVEKVIFTLLNQLKTQQKTVNKYQKLKEKLQLHPLKNELKSFRFQKVLYSGIKDKDVKYLQIILNLDEDTKVRDKGKGSFKNEIEYFGYFTQQALIKFQEKYKEDILQPINKKKGTGIVGIMTIKKLNEILEEIVK